MKWDPYLIPYTKMNSKWIKRLNKRAKTIRSLEGSIGRKLRAIGLGNDFLVVTSKAQTTREKMEQLATLKLKTFVHQRAP